MEKDHIVMESLSFYPIQSITSGVFSQKCYMDTSIIQMLNSDIGEFVEINLPNTSVICCVWPSNDKYGKTCINFEETVTKATTEQNYRITPLTCAKADYICIDVIVRDYFKFHSWRTSEHILKDLKKKCLNCLRNLCVKENFSVNLESSRLAHLYGIQKILIHKIQNCSKTDAFIIHKKASVDINSVQSSKRFSLLQKSSPINLGGLTDALNELTDLIYLPLLHSDKFKKLNLSRPKGILLRGPPGCGKTSLVNFISFKCKAALVTISGPDVLGSRPGETEENIKTVFLKAQNLSLEGLCIVFIDEIDTLCPKRGNSLNESRSTSAIMSCLDMVQNIDNLVVIGATNRPSAIDPALRRPGRLEREILISVPNKVQRQEILKLLTTEICDADIELLSEMTNGYVGADLQSLCNEAAYCAISRHGNEKIGIIEIMDFKSAIKKIVPSLEKGTVGIVDVKHVLWSDIGGLQEVKDQIKQAVEWPMLHPEAFSRLGLPVSKGVMLYGPPGCCKTTLVRAAATATNTTFLALNGAQLISPFVGESERLVAETFQKARALAPSIIFLDEIDSIVGKRSDGSKGVQERLLSMLLNEMDGIGVKLDDKTSSNRQLEGGVTSVEGVKDIQHDKVDNSRVLVVAATNRPDLVDDALLRPGRIDKIIYVPPPDTQARLEILKICCKKIPVEDNVNLSALADQTEYYTGADLASLCREAAMCSMSENIEASSVNQNHFTTASSLVKPSLNLSLIEKYKQLHILKTKS